MRKPKPEPRAAAPIAQDHIEIDETTTTLPAGGVSEEEFDEEIESIVSEEEFDEEIESIGDGTNENYDDDVAPPLDDSDDPDYF